MTGTGFRAGAFAILKSIVYIGMLAALFTSCTPEHTSEVLSEDEPYALDYPDYFPDLDIPEDNTPTEARVELGKRLFFDTRLSRTNTVSCASCHLPELAFSDQVAISAGVDGRLGERNAPTLANVGFQPRFNSDGGVPSLELQALVPIHDENELDFSNLELIERLNADPQIVRLSEIAYRRPFDTYVLTRALATYQRTLVSADSKYDRVLRGEDSFSESEQHGFDLFQSEATECSSCHSDALQRDDAYHNIGLYIEYEDPGRRLVTGDPEDEGAFKTPSLRNITETAPYMHDGSMATLREALEFFNAGGAGHPLQDARIQPLGLSESDLDDLEAFLATLTDPVFLSNSDLIPE